MNKRIFFPILSVQFLLIVLSLVVNIVYYNVIERERDYRANITDQFNTEMSNLVNFVTELSLNRDQINRLYGEKSKNCIEKKCDYGRLKFEFDENQTLIKIHPGVLEMDLTKGSNEVMN